VVCFDSSAIKAKTSAIFSLDFDQRPCVF